MGEHQIQTYPEGRPRTDTALRLRRTADQLTAFRLVLAPILAWLIGTGSFSVAAIMLGTSWVTDWSDGRLARRSGQSGRLANWDLPADTLVGAAVLIGLALDQSLWPPFAWSYLLITLLLYWRLRNEAISFLLQGLGYGAFLWLLILHRPSGWWFPLVIVLLLLTLDWRRFWGNLLPRFFKGIGIG